MTLTQVNHRSRPRDRVWPLNSWEVTMPNAYDPEQDPIAITPARVALRIAASKEAISRWPENHQYAAGAELGRRWAAEAATFKELEGIAAEYDQTGLDAQLLTSINDYAKPNGWPSLTPAGGRLESIYAEGIKVGAYQVWAAVYDLL